MSLERPASSSVQLAVRELSVGRTFTRHKLEQANPSLRNHDQSSINLALREMNCISATKADEENPKATIVYTREKLPGDICVGCKYMVRQDKRPKKTWRCEML